MTKPTDTYWAIDAHTLAKHRILREYLQAWLPIVGTRFPRIRLVDGFAGPGRYVGGEPGSPVIMLNALLEHASAARITASVEYVFIEEREDRYEALGREVATLRPLPANMTIDPRLGKFDEHMPSIVPDSEPDRPPTFAFIDPFGWTDAPMQLTSSVLGIDHCEALIYVPLPFIARFVTDSAIKDSLMLLYGNAAWTAARGVNGDARVGILRTAFEESMLNHCSYVRAFDIRPDGNRGYTLFFGTRHVRGLEKMKEVMWNVDPAGGCLYTDATDPGQEVLFQPEPDHAQLEAMLRDHFGVDAFTIEEAEHFVLVSTPFAKSGLKTRVLRPAEAAGRLEAVQPLQNRRQCTYPPGTHLRFSS